MAGSWNGTQYFGDATNETVVGTAADEVIWADLGMDNISGLGGNDTIDGGLDSDTIFGGAGDDQLYDLNSFSSGYTGLVGKDQVFGGIGNDTVHWNSVDTGDVADGGAGIDTLVIRFDFLGASTTLPVAFALGPVTGCYVSGIFGLSAAKFERVEFYASDGDDILSGGALDDQLFGGKGSDTLSGLGGNDIISTGTGNFVASGGGGSDLLVLDLSNNFEAILLRLTNAMSVSTSLTVGSAMGFEALNVVSGSGDDRLTGGDLGDSLNSGAGDDVLFGGLGDDLLTLGQGAGRADGGDGNDRITYSNDVMFSTVMDPGDKAYGGNGDDAIQFARGGNNVGYGGAGNDVIGVYSAGVSLPTVNRLYGDDGNDHLSGGNGADLLFGGIGDDVIGAFPGVQMARGGSGNDTVIINGTTSAPVAAGQVLDGGAGFDRLNWTGQLGGVIDLTGPSYTTGLGTQFTGFEAFGLFLAYQSDATILFGNGDDKVDGTGAAHLTFDGGGGNDRLYARATVSATLSGGGGDDRLASYFGTTGSQLDGGAGNDLLCIFNIAGSTMDGGGGVDVAQFTSSVLASLVTGQATRAGQVDVLIGIEGLSGGGGDDTLIGNIADNQLFGGGLGADQIITGGGNDTVLTTLFGGGTTHVTDFDPARDTIGLAGFTSLLPYGTLDPARLLFGNFAAAPAATLAGPQFFYDPTTGNLWQDRDGTGSATPWLAMVLDNHPVLDASDFVVADYLYNALV